MTKEVIIVDYGMGNLWSVQSAIRYLGGKPVLSGEPSVIAGADTLILPGVGSFRKAMQALVKKGLVDALNEAVQVRQRKILGICLGMQLFAEKGTEDGGCAGLGFIPGIVERFSQEELGILKLPHIGFNSVSANSESKLFCSMGQQVDFYFVHSYRLLATQMPGNFSMCHYGIDFLAGFEHQNIFATQFHPEKSQTNGLHLLKNFLSA